MSIAEKVKKIIPSFVQRSAMEVTVKSDSQGHTSECHNNRLIKLSILGIPEQTLIRDFNREKDLWEKRFRLAAAIYSTDRLSSSRDRRARPRRTWP